MNETLETHKNSSTTNSHFSLRVIIYGLAALLLIIISTGGGYLLGIRNNMHVEKQIAKVTPSKIDPLNINNWITYKNVKDNYSIKYPSNFATFQLLHVNEGSVLFGLPKPSDHEDEQPVLLINKGIITIYTTWHKCISNEGGGIINIPCIEYHRTFAAGLGGKPAEEFQVSDVVTPKYPDNPYGIDYRVIQTMNDPYYQIRDYGVGGTGELINRMISTFKFEK